MYRTHGVTYERVRAELDYNPETGELTWRSTKSGRSNGPVAGTIQECHSGHKRRKVMFDYKYYMAHRIIWLWMTGKWPKHDVDHADHDGLNNRWHNLRDFTKKQNNDHRRSPYNHQ